MKTAVSAEAPSRFLKAKEVSLLTSLSSHTINLLSNEGVFPKPLRLSERRVAWRESDIWSWMTSRVTAA